MTDSELAKSPAFAGLTPEQIAFRIATLTRAGELYAKYADEPGYPAWRGAAHAYPRRHHTRIVGNSDA